MRFYLLIFLFSAPGLVNTGLAEKPSAELKANSGSTAQKPKVLSPGEEASIDRSEPSPIGDKKKGSKEEAIDKPESSSAGGDKAENLKEALDKPESVSSAQDSRQTLRKILSAYRLKSYRLEIQQEVFLSPLKIKIKSEGFLDMKGEKFYLKLKGAPSTLTVFDGQLLWHQPDLSEKTAFQFSGDQPLMKLLSGFFQPEQLLSRFQILRLKKTKKGYVFHLQPKKNEAGAGLEGGLSSVFVRAEDYISEIRLIWKELNNWQKYHLKAPELMDFDSKHFTFSTEGVELIKKISQ